MSQIIVEISIEYIKKCIYHLRSVRKALLVKNYRQTHNTVDGIKSYFVLKSECTDYAMNTLNETGFAR